MNSFFCPFIVVAVSGAFDERSDGPFWSSSDEPNPHGPPPFQRTAYWLPNAQSLPAAPGSPTHPARHRAAGGEESSVLPGPWLSAYSSTWLRWECLGVFQILVKVEKNPELGFSISGGVGGRGNPFYPEDNVNIKLNSSRDAMWKLCRAFINICNM